jgi:aspartate-semialdehyde dehydrogenase
MSGYVASANYEVGVVGATGAVGIEVIKCLYKRSFPLSRLHLYASARSAGKVIATEYGDIIVEEYSLAEARKCQLIFLAVSGDFALENGKALTEGDGPVVIDNSSAFRYMPEIPLVVSACPSTHPSCVPASLLCH